MRPKFNINSAKNKPIITTDVDSTENIISSREEKHEICETTIYEDIKNGDDFFSIESSIKLNISCVETALDAELPTITEITTGVVVEKSKTKNRFNFKNAIHKSKFIESSIATAFSIAEESTNSIVDEPKTIDSVIEEPTQFIECNIPTTFSTFEESSNIIVCEPKTIDSVIEEPTQLIESNIPTTFSTFEESSNIIVYEPKTIDSVMEEPTQFIQLETSRVQQPAAVSIIAPAEDPRINNPVVKKGRFNPKSASSKVIPQAIIEPYVAQEECDSASLVVEKVIEVTELIEKPNKEKSAPQKIRINCKNALSKDCIKSPLKSILPMSTTVQTVEVISQSCVTTTIEDNRSVSSMSDVSRTRKKQIAFVLKDSSLVPRDDTVDQSQLSIKSLINMTAREPPPKSRASHTNAKRSSIIGTVSDTASIAGSVLEQADAKSECPYRMDIDGNIVMNTAANTPKMVSSEGFDVIVEDATCLQSTYRTFAKRKLSGKRWKPIETDNFYKALFIVGTDFYAMADIFEGRTRADLKQKYRVELKKRPGQIDFILNNPQQYNLETVKFDSHVVKSRPRVDAVKRILKCADDDSDQSEEIISKRKKRKFSLDPESNGLNLADGDAPSYLNQRAF